MDEVQRGRFAKQVLDNPVFQEAEAMLNEYLTRREMACNTAKEPEVASDIVRCRQLLAALVREFRVAIQDGDIEEIRIKELEPRKALFRR